MKIALISNTSWYIYNFRGRLIDSLLNEGYKTITIAPVDKFTKKLEKKGCSHYSITIDSKNHNPVNEIRIISSFKNIFKISKPDIVLNFTAKPNIYATIAASSLKIPTINNIAGLGLGFINKSLISSILKRLYKHSQSKASKVFFQNPDDRELFLKSKIVDVNKTELLPGSGVDLDRFCEYPIQHDESTEFWFLLVARMLYSKGIPELIKAAEELYSSGYTNIKIQLLGALGISSSDAISKQAMDNWAKKSFVEYLGETENVIPFIQNSHCIVLPSYYREGVPRSLLESLSIGRPIITTNMPGCKETVIHNKNGFIVQPKDYKDLSKKMKKMLSLDSQQLNKMGHESRELAEKKFDERIVIQKYLNSIREILDRKK